MRPPTLLARKLTLAMVAAAAGGEHLPEFPHCSLGNFPAMYLLYASYCLCFWFMASLSSHATLGRSLSLPWLLNCKMVRIKSSLLEQEDIQMIAEKLCLGWDLVCRNGHSCSPTCILAIWLCTPSIVWSPFLDPHESGLVTSTNRMH